MGKVCDVSSLDKLSAAFDSFSEESRRKAMLESLAAGAKVLQSQAREELVRKLGPGATRAGRKGGKQSFKPMVEGIRVIKDKDYNLAVVSIMKDFRLKWVEKGTEQRWAGPRKDSKARKDSDSKGKYFRGRMTATNFFMSAREHTQEIEQAILLKLDQEIKKLIK